MHATKKNMQAFIGQVLKGRLKSINKYFFNEKYIPFYLPDYGEFENYCFVSVAPTVCVSHAFVYDAVNVNKIIFIISSTKLPSYLYAQVPTGLTLYLG